MRDSPLLNQAQGRSGAERASEHLPIQREGGLLALVLRMKVGHAVLAVVHVDHDAEELGDAYVALGRYDEARASYQAALGEAQPTVDQGLIQLKLLDLPSEAAGASDEDSSE